jgi:hypothetical protein
MSLPPKLEQRYHTGYSNVLVGVLGTYRFDITRRRERNDRRGRTVAETPKAERGDRSFLPIYPVVPMIIPIV